MLAKAAVAKHEDAITPEEEIGRQRRLRVSDDWYRIDLLFFIASCGASSSSISSAAGG
jgi:hypothetical protein